VSLIVYAYRREGDRFSDLDAKPTPPRNQLAGFESWRQSIYGSAAAKKLGLRLLPTLGDGHDIYAEGADLDRLKSEAEMMLANLEGISPEDPEGVRFRLENILEAIRLAKQAGGGVYVG
jgi:hypothetical protein